MAIQNVFSKMISPIMARIHSLRRIKHRQLTAQMLADENRLHLACGTNVLDGWANIDLESNDKIIGWDLTESLPVRSETIDLIFCEHFIEHITIEQAKALLTDCHRLLKPNGILRLSTPNLKKIVNEYLLGRTEEWHDVGFYPPTPCRMVNDAFHLWGHQYVYDGDELKQLLAESGYHKITPVAWRESTTPALKNLECRPFHGEIIYEASK